MRVAGALLASACAAPGVDLELHDRTGSCESVTVELIATATTLTTTERFLPDGQLASRHLAVHVRGELEESEAQLWWYGDDGRARSMSVTSTTPGRDGLLEVYDRDEQGQVEAEHHSLAGEPTAEIARTFTADGQPWTERIEPVGGGVPILATWSYTDGRVVLYENVNPETGGLHTRRLYRYEASPPSLDAYIEAFDFGVRSEHVERYDAQRRLTSWKVDRLGEVQTTTWTYTPDGQVARRTLSRDGWHDEITDSTYDDDGHLIATHTALDVDRDGEPDEPQSTRTWEWTCW